MISKFTPPTHVAEGTQIEGDLVFFSQAEIFGTVEGNIRQQSLDTLLIGPFGLVHGDIQSRGPIIVSGSVDGILHCETQILILPTAKITGTVSAPSVSVAAGAIVNAAFVTNTRSCARHLKAA